MPLDFFKVARNPIGDRIAHGFFLHCPDDRHLSFENFVRTFAIFRPVRDSLSPEGINSRASKVKEIAFKSSFS